jgi:poly-gamma-glutamate synthesis protein (capsule biosynthesis protein)
MVKSVSIALTGDVMLGRGVNEAIRQSGPAWPWGNTVESLKRADLTIINLECVIACSGRPWSRWEKVFHFRAGTSVIAALQLAGVDAVVLANNHVLDYEEEAFLEMLEHLQKNGVAWVGAGRNLEEARRPAILKTPGLKVGLVAFTDNEPGWAATETSPGTNYIEISLNENSLQSARECLAAARAAGAELVIFSIHWGPNMAPRPSALFRRFAHAVMDAGADVFHGHSAHIFQGIELYRGRPIIYDAGDFVDDYAVDPVLRNDLGLLFSLQIEERRVSRIELIPVKIAGCQVNIATGQTYRNITERIRALSAEMKTAVHQEDERLWIDCRNASEVSASFLLSADQ